MGEHQNSMEVCAERLKNVFASVKVLLEGCSSAEDTIQSRLEALGALPDDVQLLLDTFRHRVEDAELADAYVKDEVAQLVSHLCWCSDKLFAAGSIDAVLRVEVVNRLLFSTLQNFPVSLDALANLEKLTQEQNRLEKEFLSYGYGGITLTRKGSLQVDPTQLMDSGKHALQKACLLEPLLVNEILIDRFWGHFRQLSMCFRKDVDGGIAWFEAAVKVAKFGFNYEAAGSHFDLGLSLYQAAKVYPDNAKKEGWYGKGVIHLKNSIALFENSDYPAARKADAVIKAHGIIGEWAFFEQKDFALAMHHFADGAQIASTNSLYLLESRCAQNYGLVLLEAKPDKLGEVSAAFRQGLEAILKAIPSSSVPLDTIHTATIGEREGILRCIQDLPPEGKWFLSGGKPVENLSWIHDELWEVPTSLIVARARAHYILGFDYYYLGEFDRALEEMLSGIRILEAERQTDEIGDCQSEILLGSMRFTLGEIHYNNARYPEAIEQFQHCGNLHDLKDAIRAYEGHALVRCGDDVGALEKFKEVLSLRLIDSNLWKPRANVLIWKGLTEFRTGDFDECILSLEEARKLDKQEKTAHTDSLVELHTHLVEAYIRKREYWAASQIVETFQPFVDKHHKGDSHWQVWQATKVATLEKVGDLRTADIATEPLNDMLDNTETRLLRLSELMAKSAVYRREADIDGALEALDEMEELTIATMTSEDKAPKLVGGYFHMVPKKNLMLAQIYINRAAVLLRALNDEAKLQRAVHEAEQAVLLLREEEGQELPLASALACQAGALENLSECNGDRPGSKIKELIDEAITLAETRDSLLLAKFKYLKANAVLPGDPMVAAAEGSEAALIFAYHQLQLRDMESAWVSMFGLEMKHLFLFMQTLSLHHLKMPMKALLWAERGRTRLFVYMVRKQEDINFLSGTSSSDCDTLLPNLVEKLVDDLEHVQLHNNRQKASSSKEEWLGQTEGEICDGSPLINRSISSNLPHESGKDTDDNLRDAAELSGLDGLWFDKDDALAEKYLFQAVEQCGLEALILEYTFLTLPSEHVLIYAVFMKPGGGRHVVKWRDVDVQSLLEGQREGRKKRGRTLTTLISKTREYILKKEDDEAMEGLSLLHSVLIQPVEKYVNRCQRLILSIHEELALVPFAALFNKETGKFLVQEKTVSYIPSIRVLHYCFHRQREFERELDKGLLENPFVAGNPEPMGWGMHPLPEAAQEAELVAELLGVRPCIGPDMTKEAVTAGLSNASLVLLATHGVVNAYFPHGALILRGCDSSTQDFESSPNGSVNDSASITSDELASLPSRIRAGLVVLSTCKSGEGEITSEGLLGFGRALLQGGAPSAILALWEVADSSNKVLIGGVFELLVKHGKDVATALQEVMLQLIESKEKKYHIFHWAPLVVLGAPLFKYLQRPDTPGTHRSRVGI